MKMIKFKPTSPGVRHRYDIMKNMLSKTNKFDKSTITHVQNNAGKCRLTGHTTAYHRGGGHKKQYREINFTNKPYEAIVLTTMYDPYRSAFINFNWDLNEEKFFRTVGTELVYPGSLLNCTAEPEELKLGTRTKLKNIPPGTRINQLALGTKVGSSKIKYIRSAGTYGKVIQTNDDGLTQVEMPSGLIRIFDSNSWATIGAVSNSRHNQVVLGKAGRNRHRGWRPHVRGIAMNPVDHPHGGRGNGGRPSCTPWGLPCKDGFSLVKRRRSVKIAKWKALKKGFKAAKTGAPAASVSATAE